MAAINPADCKWEYSHSEPQYDINGTVVANIDIYVCVTEGHGRHWIAQ